MMFIPSLEWWQLGCLLLLYTFAPRNWIPGELVTSGMMNTLRDLFIAVEGGNAKMKRIHLRSVSAQDGGMISTAGNATLCALAPGELYQNLSGGAWSKIETPSSIGQHDLYIPARAFRPWPNYPCGPVTDLTFPSTANTISYRPFPKSSVLGYFDIMLPGIWNTSTMYFTVYWFVSEYHPGTNVLWQLYGIGYGNNESIDTDWTGMGELVAEAYGENHLIISPIPQSAGPGPQPVSPVANGSKKDYARMCLFRPGYEPRDTYPVGINCIGVRLTFVNNAYTDV